MFKTKKELIKLGYKKFSSYGLFCEVWRKGESLWMWNKVTHKVYVMC